MPRGGSNQMPSSVKKRYFELVREGHMGAAAARRVGVSTSCGSLWFLDAGGVMISDPGPISPRFLDQDDRIAIADGLRAGQHKKEIAVSLAKSFQTVYREVARNSKPDGTYQPWWAHNQALRREETTQAGESSGRHQTARHRVPHAGEQVGPAAASPAPRPLLPGATLDAFVRGNDLPHAVRGSPRSQGRQTPYRALPASHIGVAWPARTR